MLIISTNWNDLSFRIVIICGIICKYFGTFIAIFGIHTSHYSTEYNDGNTDNGTKRERDRDVRSGSLLFSATASERGRRFFGMFSRQCVERKRERDLRKTCAFLPGGEGFPVIGLCCILWAQRCRCVEILSYFLFWICSKLRENNL